MPKQMTTLLSNFYPLFFKKPDLNFLKENSGDNSLDIAQSNFETRNSSVNETNTFLH